MDEDRLKHSLAVARKMEEIAKTLGLSEKEINDCFVIGLNHDIGYEYGNNSNHAHIGGEILKRNNYKYWKEFYYHGNINTEYTSLFLTILNKTDMQVDKYGNDVGYTKRLEDIKSRYGENSTTYQNAEILILNLRSENQC